MSSEKEREKKAAFVRIYNEGRYKIFKFFGIKLKIRSRVLELRARLNEEKIKRQELACNIRDIRECIEQVKLQIRGLEGASLEFFSNTQKHLGANDKSIEDIRKRIAPLSDRVFKNILRAKKLPQINRDYIESLVENMHEMGTSGRDDTPRLIVSLTSYPKRMYDIHLCLYSIFTQDLKPDKVVLWLAREQFPNGEVDIPAKVLRLKDYGLTIKWCDDIRSYKKLIPSMQEWPDACIVTADDDIYYPSNWLQDLWETYTTTGDCLVAHRCHRVVFDEAGVRPYREWEKTVTGYHPSYLNFFTGAGGVLYSPGCLHKDILNIEKFQTLCPNADDIWFWAMAVLKGTKIALALNPITTLTFINPERESNANGDGTLYATNGPGGNDAQLLKVLEAYPELMEKLMSEE